VADDPATGKATVYVNAPDGYFYALDAATGAVAWKSVVHIPSTTKNDYFAWGSPLLANGNVYVGISSNCDNPLVPAGVLAFNQASGAQVAQWNSLPAGKVGASVWSTPAQAADGRIIAATGNGYNSSGQPLYDDSIVALDPGTLSVLDSWQVPAAQQTQDGDFGGPATMFTATIGGVRRPGPASASPPTTSPPRARPSPAPPPPSSAGARPARCSSPAVGSPAPPPCSSPVTASPPGRRPWCPRPSSTSR
jgi:outer membrane protein assembly factor BamB